MPVENFGEALPPARRAFAAKLSEDLADDDIAKRSLSEIWPISENDAIEEPFAAAVAHAARAEIPSKPRIEYKLRRWSILSGRCANLPRVLSAVARRGNRWSRKATAREV